MFAIHYVGEVQENGNNHDSWLLSFTISFVRENISFVREKSCSVIQPFDCSYQSHSSIHLNGEMTCM